MNFQVIEEGKGWITIKLFITLEDRMSQCSVYRYSFHRNKTQILILEKNSKANIIKQLTI